MPAKRALKLEALSKSNHETPYKENQKLLRIFSPSTGTCRRSPSLSPTAKHDKPIKLASNVECADLNPLEVGLSRRGQTQIVEMDDYMVLHARAETSLAHFLKMRKKLKNVQALEGSRELENIFGVSDASSDLKAELQKNKELMVEVKKRKLMHPSTTKHP